MEWALTSSVNVTSMYASDTSCSEISFSLRYFFLFLA